MHPPPTIAVVGSLNIDLTFQVKRIPRSGETLTATRSHRCFGGKGANQAVAATRAGATTHLIGCIGAEPSGPAFRSYLDDLGVITRGLMVSAAEPTGRAFITVDAAGENTIVVHPGANHALSVEHVKRALGEIQALDAVLLQLECPYPVVAAAARWAREHGVPVVLNPSPWLDDVGGAGVPVDVMIVNETEGAALLGCSLEAIGRGEILTDRVALYQALIITRGADATLVYATDLDPFSVQPPQVEPVDTVGAGDAFAGAFTVMMARGASMQEAVAFANATAALATLKLGAQEAIPTRESVDAFLQER